MNSYLSAYSGDKDSNLNTLTAQQDKLIAQKHYKRNQCNFIDIFVHNKCTFSA